MEPYFWNGKLLRPKKYQGFELGHVIINEKGPECPCGNHGCVEAYCSMKILKQKIAKRKGLNSISGIELTKILENELKDFEDIVDEYILYIYIALTNYINIFEPEAICIGGSFAYHKDILFNKLLEKIERENRTFNKTKPAIVIAKYENDAGIIGATLI